MRNDELDQIIEKSFGAEFDFKLPANFAQKVSVAVVRREQFKNDVLEYLSLTGIIFGLVAVLVGLYYYVDKKLIMELLSFLSGNAIQVILVIFLLNFILFADRVLLRLLFSRWNRG